jgi:hypothetical protein
MELKLISQPKALKLIAQIGQQGAPFEISLGEDICFGPNNWIKVGTICLKPGRQIDETEARYDEFCAAKFGGFEWQLPTQEELEQNISKALNNSKYTESVKKAFYEGLQDVIRRSLLLLPVFDIEAIRRMPLRKPMTIVPDTSAVHQGALDFVCRFLTPWARIKVPAIVHMEILTHVDNYLSKIRWSSENRKKVQSHPATLRQHLLSQGGQRTLLRLELHSDAEMERGDLGADPQRGIVTASSDPEDKALGLQNVTRSFADLLIVETARRVQTQVRPDHPLALLTSDQGMARMAMAEGMEVFFFQARSVPQFAGRTLTGTLFHPFQPALYTLYLTEILWELATAFGCLRLHNPENDALLELWGIGGSEEVTWQPLYTKDELLWSQFKIGTSAPNRSVAPRQVSLTSPSLPQQTQISSRTRIYSFSPDKMFLLIKMLVDKGSLKHEQAQEVIALTNKSRYREYKNFLQSGQFVTDDGNHIISTDTLKSFWQSLIEEDTIHFQNGLKKFPSFKALYDYMAEHRLVEEKAGHLPISDREKSAYLKLGEAAGAWLNISGKGIVATPHKPTDFARLATEVYEQIRVQEKTEWIITGHWLEALALQQAVHPIVAKKLLEKMQDQKLLRVYAEGSTPDTRFDLHVLWIIKTIDGLPQLEKVFLYHGDFFMPSTATVRIKIQGVTNAS